MTARLSEDQIEASDAADARGESFAQVTPDMLFSKSANMALSQQVYNLNPRRYRQLREEWEMSIGATPRPLEYWHAQPQKGSN